MKKQWTVVKLPVWWCWCVKQKKNKQEKQPEILIPRPIWWCWYFRQK